MIVVRRARNLHRDAVHGDSIGHGEVAVASPTWRARWRSGFYGAYADGNSIAPPEVRDAIVATVRSHWGLGSRVLADIFLGDAGAEERERFARLQRTAASAETAGDLEVGELREASWRGMPRIIKPLVAGRARRP